MRGEELIMIDDAKADEAVEFLDEIPLWPHALRLTDPALQPLWLRWLNIFIMVSAKVLNQVAVMCFFIMLAIAFIGVVFRYVVNSPITWSDSLALWLLIWLSFLGAPYPLDQGTHYIVEWLVTKFPLRMQIWTAIVVNIMVLSFCVAIFWTSIWLCLINIRQTASPIELPYAIPYSAIPIGFFVICLIVIRDSAELLLNLYRRRV